MSVTPAEPDGRWLVVTGVTCCCTGAGVWAPSIPHEERAAAAAAPVSAATTVRENLDMSNPSIEGSSVALGARRRVRTEYGGAQLVE
jgi:hypothetical protein